MKGFEPAYLNLLRSGELKERVKEAYQRLEACEKSIGPTLHILGCTWVCPAGQTMS